MNVNVKRIGDHDLPIPVRESRSAGALDLRATQGAMICPGSWALVGTGFAYAIPEGHIGQVCPRSGLALSRGVTVKNAPGIIDADYRGEVCVILENTGHKPFTFEAGDRIAQLLITPAPVVTLVELGALDETERAAGGFGSTGVA